MVRKAKGFGRCPRERTTVPCEIGWSRVLGRPASIRWPIALSELAGDFINVMPDFVAYHPGYFFGVSKVSGIQDFRSAGSITRSGAPGSPHSNGTTEFFSSCVTRGSSNQTFGKDSDLVRWNASIPLKHSASSSHEGCIDDDALWALEWSARFMASSASRVVVMIGPLR